MCASARLLLQPARSALSPLTASDHVTVSHASYQSAARPGPMVGITSPACRATPPSAILPPDAPLAERQMREIENPPKCSHPRTAIDRDRAHPRLVLVTPNVITTPIHVTAHAASSAAITHGGNCGGPCMYARAGAGKRRQPAVGSTTVASVQQDDDTVAGWPESLPPPTGVVPTNAA
jgi:hypothetical protein